MVNKQKSKRGGPRPGSGRKKIAEKLTNYSRAVSMLDESICEALAVVRAGLKDRNKLYRFKCAELVVKKAIPDRVHFEEPERFMRITFIDGGKER